MSSVTQTTSDVQVIPIAILQFRPNICPHCLNDPPENCIMWRVRIKPLKRHADVWSARFRCPQPNCKANYSVRLRLTEQGLTIVTWPDEIVFAYAEGNGTNVEIAKEHDLNAGSTVWRAVEAVANQVEAWIGECIIFLNRHLPESLNQLLWPRPPLDLANRRFRLPEKVRLLSLIRELPDWVKACTQALKIEWPYGVLRFLRSITLRFIKIPKS